MPDQDQKPSILNRLIAPTGSLPKNFQSWLLVAVAVLMALVIAFSSRAAPGPKPPTTKIPQAAQMTDVNTAQIIESKVRLEEAVRQLETEKAKLAQMGAQANGPAPPDTMPTYVASNGGGYSNPAYDRAATERIGRRKKEEESLFASNIVQSLRLDTASQSATQASRAFDPESFLQQAQARAVPEPDTRPTAESPGRVPGKTDRSPVPAELTLASGKLYRLFEGTFFETVLTNRLDGTYSGPVNCMVANDVYSQDGQRLLVPRGSRILGHADRVEAIGQTRLAVSFSRLIMPDGFSVNLEQFQGLNQVGETGLKDQVNNHYARIFGASIAIGALGGLSQSNTRSGADTSGLDIYRQGVASSFAQSSMRVLDRFLNTLPTVTIQEGYRIKIFLTNDLLLPAYERHQLAGDL